MKRMVAVTAAVALASSLLAACGSSSGGDASSGKVTLKFSSYAWQAPTIAANKKIVGEWNKAHPDIQVQYIAVDADSVHDKLVTQFASNNAPDVIHDEAADIAGFAKQGYLSKLNDMLPADLKAGVPQGVWDSVTFNGGVYGLPSLLQSYVVFANKTLLQKAGVTPPTVRSPWTWDQFQQAALKLTAHGVYGVGWGLKSPVSPLIDMSLNYGGQYFYGGNVRFGAPEQQIPQRVHDMIFKDRSLAPQSVGLSGADALPGFFGGKYAMVVGGNYLSQQMVQQAPKGFQWEMLPLLKGDNQNQVADPQTYSIATQSKHPKQAMQFLDYFLSAANLAQLSQGDWLAPATTQAAAAVQTATKGANGWDVVLDSLTKLAASPAAQLTSYPQWKEEIATPAFQQYLAGKIDLSGLSGKLTSGWKSVNHS